MASLTAAQLAWRGRIERLIALAAPGLDLVLAAGERVSRIVEADDSDWDPPLEPPAHARAIRIPPRAG